MRIRPANSGDLAEICGLHIRSWRDAYRGLLPETYLTDGIEEDLGAHWRKLEHHNINLVAEITDEHGGRLAGFLVVRMDHSDGPFLDNFHVEPELRSGGIGKALFHAMRTRLRMKKATSFWLEVMEENHGARRFYALQGGRESPAFVEQFAGTQITSRKVHFSRV